MLFRKITLSDKEKNEIRLVEEAAKLGLHFDKGILSIERLENFPETL